MKIQRAACGILCIDHAEDAGLTAHGRFETYALVWWYGAHIARPQA
jgi:hypothetical protein